MTSVLFNQTVMLHRRGEVVGRDSLNDPIYGDDVIVPSPGWVERAANVEDGTFRQLETSSYTLWLDGRVSLAGVDKVTFEGATYEVDGPPGYQPGGIIVDGFTFANLKRVTG